MIGYRDGIFLSLVGRRCPRLPITNPSLSPRRSNPQALRLYQRQLADALNQRPGDRYLVECRRCSSVEENRPHHPGQSNFPWSIKSPAPVRGGNYRLLATRHIESVSLYLERAPHEPMLYSGEHVKDDSYLSHARANNILHYIGAKSGSAWGVNLNPEMGLPAASIPPKYFARVYIKPNQDPLALKYRTGSNDLSHL